MVPKAGRKQRFGYTSMNALLARPVNKKQEGAVTSLFTQDVKMPLALYIAKLVFPNAEFCI